jgi:hypothetical protein
MALPTLACSLLVPNLGTPQNASPASLPIVDGLHTLLQGCDARFGHRGGRWGGEQAIPSPARGHAALRGPLRVPRGVKCRYSCLSTRTWGARAWGDGVGGRGRLCCASCCASCNPPCNHARGPQPPRSEAQTRIIDVSGAWGARGPRWGRY